MDPADLLDVHPDRVANRFRAFNVLRLNKSWLSIFFRPSDVRSVDQGLTPMFVLIRCHCPVRDTPGNGPIDLGSADAVPAELGVIKEFLEPRLFLRKLLGFLFNKLQSLDVF